MPDEVLLQVDNVNVQYGSLQVLWDISLEVREQEMVLKIHDLPTIFHFRYWVQVCIERFLVRFRSPSSRKKISSEI